MFTLFYTSIFTNGAGFFTGMVGSLGYWLEQQGVERGSQPWYYYAWSRCRCMNTCLPWARCWRLAWPMLVAWTETRLQDDLAQLEPVEAGEPEQITAEELAASEYAASLSAEDDSLPRPDQPGRLQRR